MLFARSALQRGFNFHSVSPDFQPARCPQRISCNAHTCADITPVHPAEICGSLLWFTVIFEGLGVFSFSQFLSRTCPAVRLFLASRLPVPLLGVCFSRKTQRSGSSHLPRSLMCAMLNLPTPLRPQLILRLDPRRIHIFLRWTTENSDVHSEGGCVVEDGSALSRPSAIGVWKRLMTSPEAPLFSDPVPHTTVKVKDTACDKKGCIHHVFLLWSNWHLT